MGSLGAGRIWSTAAEAQAVPGAGCWGRAALLCGHQAFGGVGGCCREGAHHSAWGMLGFFALNYSNLNQALFKSQVG